MDNALEAMIRHEPDATGCWMVPKAQRPINMKRKVLHVKKGIVMIAEQGCKGLINDLEDYGFEEGMPCPTPHKILAPEVF
jgi:hypothetical protein